MSPDFLLPVCPTLNKLLHLITQNLKVFLYLHSRSWFASNLRHSFFALTGWHLFKLGPCFHWMKVEVSRKDRKVCGEREPIQSPTRGLFCFHSHSVFLCEVGVMVFPTMGYEPSLSSQISIAWDPCKYGGQ